jgi:hypothetical protein
LDEIKGVIKYDQLLYIKNFLEDRFEIIRQNLIKRISNDLIDFFSQMSPRRKLIFQNLAREIYSPILSAALIRNLISPENSLNFILAEENFQLKKWPTIGNYHSAKEEEILFNIYYHLFLDSLRDGHENTST